MSNYFTLQGSGIPLGQTFDPPSYSTGTFTAGTANSGAQFQVIYQTPGTTNYAGRAIVGPIGFTTPVGVTSDPLVVDRDTLEKAYNLAVLTGDTTREAITHYVTNGGDLASTIAYVGEQITLDVNSAITRIGGVLTNLATGLLDTDVQSFFNIFYHSVTDPNVDTNRYLGDQSHRNQLQQALDNLNSQENRVIQPSTNANGVTTFNTPVQSGQPITLDPDIATGFEYHIGSGDPLFASVTFPSYGDVSNRFDLSEFINGAWRDLGEQPALVEYFFSSPVEAFRVTGIPPSLGLTDASGGQWISEVSFAGDGRFTGTITALSTPESGVPEPSTWMYALLGFFVIGWNMRRHRVRGSSLPLISGH